MAAQGALYLWNLPLARMLRIPLIKGIATVLFLGGEPFHRARRSVVDDGDEVFLFNLGRQAQDPRAFAVQDALLGPSNNRWFPVPGRSRLRRPRRS
jgi:hypothetical protein